MSDVRGIKHVYKWNERHVCVYNASWSLSENQMHLKREMQGAFCVLNANAKSQTRNSMKINVICTVTNILHQMDFCVLSQEQETYMDMAIIYTYILQNFNRVYFIYLHLHQVNRYCCVLLCFRYFLLMRLRACHDWHSTDRGPVTTDRCMSSVPYYMGSHPYHDCNIYIYIYIIKLIISKSSNPS